MTNEERILKTLDDFVVEVRGELKEIQSRLVNIEVNHSDLRGEVRANNAETQSEIKALTRRLDDYLNRKHNRWIYVGILTSMAVSIASFFYTIIK